MNLGERLKKARVANGITQKQFAEMMYVDPSLVCRWENMERRISAEELIEILEILEMSLDEFKNMC